ncbi:superoxide dismutase [Mycobacteroides chelonae]|nr:superoxide dismutase [Mycobacteroides chelonae]
MFLNYIEDNSYSRRRHLREPWRSPCSDQSRKESTPTKKAANGVQRSGWAWLGYHTLGKKLLTFQMHDQHSHVPLGTIPLLGLDVFEHAYYYLQYKNVKADYIGAFWDVVTWADVRTRFAAAVTRGPGLIFP